MAGAKLFYKFNLDGQDWKMPVASMDQEPSDLELMKYARDQKRKSLWQKSTEGLTDAGSRIMEQVSEPFYKYGEGAAQYLPKGLGGVSGQLKVPNVPALRMPAMYTGAFLEGTGEGLDALTSPLNLATMGAGGVAGQLAKVPGKLSVAGGGATGALELGPGAAYRTAQGLHRLSQGASAVQALHGAGDIWNAEDWGDVGQGALDLGLGAIGAKQKISPLRAPKMPTAEVVGGFPDRPQLSGGQRLLGDGTTPPNMEVENLGSMGPYPRRPGVDPITARPSPRAGALPSQSRTSLDRKMGQMDRATSWMDAEPVGPFEAPGQMPGDLPELMDLNPQGLKETPVIQSQLPDPRTFYFGRGGLSQDFQSVAHELPEPRPAMSPEASAFDALIPDRYRSSMPVEPPLPTEAFSGRQEPLGLTAPPKRGALSRATTGLESAPDSTVKYRASTGDGPARAEMARRTRLGISIPEIAPPQLPALSTTSDIIPRRPGRASGPAERIPGPQGVSGGLGDIGPVAAQAPTPMAAPIPEAPLPSVIPDIEVSKAPVPVKAKAPKPVKPKIDILKKMGLGPESPAARGKKVWTVPVKEAEALTEAPPAPAKATPAAEGRPEKSKIFKSVPDEAILQSAKEGNEDALREAIARKLDEKSKMSGILRTKMREAWQSISRETGAVGDIKGLEEAMAGKFRGLDTSQPYEFWRESVKRMGFPDNEIDGATAAAKKFREDITRSDDLYDFDNYMEEKYGQKYIDFADDWLESKGKSIGDIEETGLVKREKPSVKESSERASMQDWDEVQTNLKVNDYMRKKYGVSNSRDLSYSQQKDVDAFAEELHSGRTRDTIDVKPEKSFWSGLKDETGAIGDIEALKQKRKLAMGRFADKETRPRTTPYGEFELGNPLDLSETGLSSSVARGLDWDKGVVLDHPVVNRGQNYELRRVNTLTDDALTRKRVLEQKLLELPDSSDFPPDSKRGRALKAEKAKLIARMDEIDAESAGKPKRDIDDWREEQQEMGYKEDEIADAERKASRMKIDPTDYTDIYDINEKAKTAPSERRNLWEKMKDETGAIGDIQGVKEARAAGKKYVGQAQKTIKEKSEKYLSKKTQDRIKDYYERPKTFLKDIGESGFRQLEKLGPGGEKLAVTIRRARIAEDKLSAYYESGKSGKKMDELDAARRAQEEIRNEWFGKNLEGLDNLIDQTKDPRRARQLTNQFFGRTKPGGGTNKAFYSAVTKAEAATKLSQFFISNVVNAATVASKGNVGAVGKGLIESFTDYGNAVKRAKESGALQPLLAELSKDVGSGGGIGKWFGIKKSEEMMRTFASATGRHTTAELFASLKRNPKIDSTSGKRLKDLLLVDDAELSKILKQDSLTKDQILTGMNRFAERTQGRASSLDLPPLWTEHAAFNLVTQFKRYAFTQSSNTWAAWKQDPIRVGAALATVYPLLGEVTADVKAGIGGVGGYAYKKLSGDDRADIVEEITKRVKDRGGMDVKRLLNDYSASWALGLMGDVATAGKRGESGLSDFIVGPAIQDASKGLSNVMDRDVRGLGRQGLEAIPMFGRGMSQAARPVEGSRRGRSRARRR